MPLPAGAVVTPGGPAHGTDLAPWPTHASATVTGVPKSPTSPRPCVKTAGTRLCPTSVTLFPVGYRWRPEDGFQTMQPGYLAGATKALRKRG